MGSSGRRAAGACEHRAGLARIGIDAEDQEFGRQWRRGRSCRRSAAPASLRLECLRSARFSASVRCVRQEQTADRRPHRSSFSIGSSVTTQVWPTVAADPAGDVHLAGAASDRSSALRRGSAREPGQAWRSRRVSAADRATSVIGYAAGRRAGMSRRPRPANRSSGRRTASGVLSSSASAHSVASNAPGCGGIGKPQLAARQRGRVLRRQARRPLRAYRPQAAGRPAPADGAPPYTLRASASIKRGAVAGAASAALVGLRRP